MRPPRAPAERTRPRPRALPQPRARAGRGPHTCGSSRPASCANATKFSATAKAVRRLYEHHEVPSTVRSYLCGKIRKNTFSPRAFASFFQSLLRPKVMVCLGKKRERLDENLPE